MTLSYYSSLDASTKMPAILVMSLISVFFMAVRPIALRTKTNSLAEV